MKVVRKDQINLSMVRNIRLMDKSEYQNGLSSTGGAYSYWTTFERLPNGNFEVSYGTSSEMDFCPVCGSFGCTFGCTSDDYEEVSENELLNLISSFEEDDDHFIEVEFI